MKMKPFNISTSSWFARCQKLVTADNGCKVVKVDAAAGMELIVAEEQIGSGSQVWVSLEKADRRAPRRLQRRLQHALLQAAGVSQTVNTGVSQDWVERLRPLLSRYAPLPVVVSNAQLAPAALRLLRSLAGSGISLVLQVPATYPAAAVQAFEPEQVVDSQAFRLSWQEAAQFAPPGVPEATLRETYHASDGWLRPYLNALRAQLSLPPIVIPGPPPHPRAAPVSQTVDDYITALSRRGAAVEAFECAVMHHPCRATELVRAAAPAYVEFGVQARLRWLIQRLGGDTICASDDLIRFLYELVQGTEAFATVLPLVLRVLREREAPELRSLYAVGMSTPNRLEETRRALQVMETPITLRMHGLALADHGLSDDAFEALHRAQILAGALGDAQEMIAAATDCAATAIRRGEYAHAVAWAAWALQQHGTLSRNEGARLRTTALFVTASLLRGEVEHLGVHVDALALAATQRVWPNDEWVNAALAHWSVVHNDLAAAEEYHRRNMRDHEPSLFIRVALDLLPVLHGLGKSQQALHVSQQAQLFSDAGRGNGPALGQLALLLGLDARQGAAERAHLGSQVARTLIKGGEAQRGAQAALHAADGLLLLGDRQGAERVLRDAQVGTCKLGPSGWKILSLGCANPSWLSHFGQRRDAPTRVELLGKQQVIRAGSHHRLSGRAADCLAILALEPQGATLERLTFLLYGDEGRKGSTKAMISRLRPLVPLRSQPYALETSVSCDVMDLVMALQEGDLAAALALFQGPLLPNSECPFVIEARLQLDESLQRSAIASGSVENLLDLARRGGSDDLQLFELALRRMLPSDPQSHDVRARIARIRWDWEQP